MGSAPVIFHQSPLFSFTLSPFPVPPTEREKICRLRHLVAKRRHQPPSLQVLHTGRSLLFALRAPRTTGTPSPYLSPPPLSPKLRRRRRRRVPFPSLRNKLVRHRSWGFRAERVDQPVSVGLREKPQRLRHFFGCEKDRKDATGFPAALGHRRSSA
ncbi:hypothetical protein HPB47_000727 [Ixodes persulcatus]|uniref:Uncharacterized protein n=1 Tax=Ixodes persulcatus TaxID=34615 RepID=A0AC60PSL9_IXOPE|nr:hypothetical protein HPB47_000727 [Ixodes persulcatus]